MTATYIPEECPCCGGTVQEIVIDTLVIQWGSPRGQYGLHEFTLRDIAHYRCQELDCGESFMNYEQSMEKTRRINEQVMQKLGIDWMRLSGDHNPENSSTL